MLRLRVCLFLHNIITPNFFFRAYEWCANDLALNYSATAIKGLKRHFRAFGLSQYAGGWAVVVALP